MNALLQTADDSPKSFIGRFAPSPTGELHLGSLTTAVASYCHIKSFEANNPQCQMQVKWLLRIEDTDTQRCKPEFSEQILYDLSALGLFWDDEVIYQSQRKSLYNEVINEVLNPFVYACNCSRKDLKGFSIYPRNCINKSLDKSEYKLRICLPDKQMSFFDGIQGEQWQNPQTSLGDMVIRRDKNSQNMINYILAVSIDDRLQGITHIMRGLDILPMTSAQIAISDMFNLSSDAVLGLSSNSLKMKFEKWQPSIASIKWYHLPLVLNEQGQKLSKQNLAKPIDTSTEKRCSQLLATALRFLNQPEVELDRVELMLAQAVNQWDNNLIKFTP